MSEAASGTYADGEERSRLQPRILVPALLVWAFLPGLIFALCNLLGVFELDMPWREKPMGFVEVFLAKSIRGWMLGLESGVLVLLPWMLLRPRPQPGMRAAEAVKFMLLVLAVETVWFLLQLAAGGQLGDFPLREFLAAGLEKESLTTFLSICAAIWLSAWMLAGAGPPVLRAPLHRPLSGSAVLPLALRALLVAAFFYLVWGLFGRSRWGWPSSAEMPQAASRFGLALLTNAVTYATAVVACARFRPSRRGGVDLSVPRSLAALLLYGGALLPLLNWGFYQRRLIGPIERDPLWVFWSVPGVLTAALLAVPTSIALHAVLVLPRTAPREREVT